MSRYRPVTEAEVRAVMPGLEGAVVMVPEAVAAALAGEVAAAVERRRGRIEPEAQHAFDVVATAFQWAAVKHRARIGAVPVAAAAVGSFVDGDADGPDYRPIELVNVSEAARSLGKSPRRVRDLASSGRLPAHRVGRQWMFRRSDVDEYRAERAAA